MKTLFLFAGLLTVIAVNAQERAFDKFLIP
jgi:hypothetical protein